MEQLLQLELITMNRMKIWNLHPFIPYRYQLRVQKNPLLHP